MAYPLVENAIGSFCILNGKKVNFDSTEGKNLFLPTNDITYYESIRLTSGVFVFWEAHMLRLHLSIEAKENFPINTEEIYEQAIMLFKETEPAIMDGNIRIVITHNLTLLYFSQMSYPPKAFFEEGIHTALLSWERVDPQVKVFRGDYKKAVADKMQMDTPFGFPYELLLVNGNDEITEGSRSNFFVLYDNVVYSPPEDKILIGITRHFVLMAMNDVGISLCEKAYTLSEILAMRDEHNHAPPKLALFVTSSPFDILPISSVDNEKFDSVHCPALLRLMDAYRAVVEQYIDSRSPDMTSEMTE